MLVENQDALKTWLTNTLEKLCEADPIALSKYVIALIKKDKPLEELRVSMQEQMEVFLQSETKDFVMLLFNTLDTKSYLKEVTPPKAVKQEAVPDETITETGDTAVVTVDTVEGKPDSTTAVKSAEGAGSPVKDLSYKPTRKTFEDEPRGGRARRSPPVRRHTPPPRHRRSPIPNRRFRSRSRSPVFRRGNSPFSSRRRRSSPFRRSRSRSYSPHARKFHSRGSTPTKDEDSPGYTPTARDDRKIRCRDYDEKGFCLKGDQCKFDHGNDALVLEDAAAGIVPYQPANIPPPTAVFSEPYVPAASVNLPPLHIPPPGYPPETVGANRKRPFHELASEFNTYPPQKRFDPNRLGPGGRPMLRGIRGRGRGRGGFQSERPLTAQLAVRNIPPGFNTIAHLNNHFARFGSLVNVQVHFEGDPASALVCFSSPAESAMAVNSTEAVMGNRFIKVFYHSETKNSNILPLKERIGKQSVSDDGANVSKTTINQEAVQKTVAAAHQTFKDEQKVAEIVAIKKNQELLVSTMKTNRGLDETREKMAALKKGKQELLDKLIDEQKKLLTRLEEKKATMKAEEKSQIMAMIKSMTASIEAANEDLKKLVQSSTKRRSVSDVQKELLDAELELFNAQQGGGEAAGDIQKRVNHLKVEAARLGVLPTSRSPRVRGSGNPFYAPRGLPRFPRFRGRGRGRYQGGPVVMSVDRRPSKILVSGFELDEKNSLVEHFAKFGEIVDTLEDEVTPSVIIHYKMRRYAEAAMTEGKSYNDRLLQLSWYSNATPSDYHPDLSHTGAGETPEELEDDYTPLDPAYLPAGLEEEPEESESTVKEEPLESNLNKTATESNDEFGTEDLMTEDILAEDDEEEDGERSWKR